MDTFERSPDKNKTKSNADKLKEKTAKAAAALLGLGLGSGALAGCETGTASAHETNYPTATVEQTVAPEESPSVEQADSWDVETLLKDVNIEDYQIPALDSYTNENAPTLAQAVINRDIERFEKFFMTDEATAAFDDLLTKARENGGDISSFSLEDQEDVQDIKGYYKRRAAALGDMIEDVYYASNRSQEDIDQDTDGLERQILESGGFGFIYNAFKQESPGQDFYVNTELLDAQLSQGEDGVIELVYTVKYDTNVSLVDTTSKDTKTEHSTYRFVAEDGLLKILSVSTEYNV